MTLLRSSDAWLTSQWIRLGKLSSKEGVDPKEKSNGSSTAITLLSYPFWRKLSNKGELVHIQ